MKFLYPYAFYLFIPLLAILAYLTFTLKTRYENYFSSKIVQKILIKGDKLSFKHRAILLLLAIFCLIFSLARPISEEHEVNIKGNYTSLIIAIDISRSMGADDLSPSRFEFAKKYLIKLIDTMTYTDIGIVAFAKNVFLVSPLTNDKKSLKFLLQKLQLDTSIKQGSNISYALTQIDTMYYKNDIKNVLIVSDGGDKKEQQNSISIAKKNNLHLSVIRVGTKKGGQIKLNDKNSQPILLAANNYLQKLCEKTDGNYIVENGDGKGFQALEEMIWQTNLKISKNRKIKVYNEWFIVPLVFGLVLLFFSFYSLPKTKTYFIFIFFLYAFPSYGGIFDFLHVRNSYKAIEKKKYQDAISEYNKLNPSKEVLYNRANAYYKLKKFGKAIQEYEKIKTDDKIFQSKIFFNQGNAYVQKEAFNKALKMYKKALKLTPNDEDIKKNIAYVKQLQEPIQGFDKKAGKSNQKIKMKKSKDKKGREKQKLTAGDKDAKVNADNKKDDNKTRAKKDNNQEKSSKKKSKKYIKSKESIEEKSQKWEEYLNKLQPKTKLIMLGKEQKDENTLLW